jgi:hypothetical protein
MAEERWRPVPGYSMHEVSSEGRVRTTADGSGGSSVMSLLWLLPLLAAVALALWKAHLVTTVANSLALALCSVPAGWLLYQACGELRYSWEARRYATPPLRLARLALPRAPLAIEAARPKATFIIEHEARRIDG